MAKSTVTEVLEYLHSHIKRINDSKIFAGIMIITLNIVSRFVNIKLSKSMESYLKYTFSKYVLVFTIAWMGTREILVALTVTLIFGICMEFLFNEKSAFCCLSEGFVTNRINALEAFEGIPNQLTDDEINKAVSTLKKAQEILNTSKSPPTK